jgi:methionyl-tRNA formyltransferase
MRIVFFGTPEFAVPTLDALAAAGRLPLVVVSQPARPVGRGQELQQPPVARWAADRGLPLLQPERLRDEGVMAELRALAPDVAVVVAYGKIFRPELLALPRHGCLNVHASLLPRWRGAAPIQAAIAAGDAVTGVTTMRMAAGLDTGPMLLRAEEPILPTDTTATLAPRLAALGGRLLVATLARLEAGTLVEEEQDERLATYAPQLAKADGLVRFAEPATTIANRLRAYTPWPGLQATLRGEPVKLVAAHAASGGPAAADGSSEVPPGTVVALPAQSAAAALEVACGNGSRLAIVTLQRPGKRALPAAAFANGERLEVGERFS